MAVKSKAIYHPLKFESFFCHFSKWQLLASKAPRDIPTSHRAKQPCRSFLQFRWTLQKTFKTTQRGSSEIQTLSNLSMSPKDSEGCQLNMMPEPG